MIKKVTIHIFVTATSLVLLAVLAMLIMGFWLSKKVEEDVQTFFKIEAKFELSANCEALLGQGEYYSFDEIPKLAVGAILADFDEDFFEYKLAYLASFYESLSRAGVLDGEWNGRISHYIARRMEQERTRTYKGMLTEKFRMIAIEQMVPKEQILSRFFNTAYIGEASNECPMFGYPVGAKVLFGKSVIDLKPSQLAYIAVLSWYPEFRSQNRKELGLKKRNRVLNRMGKLGYLSEEELHISIAEPFEPNSR